MATPFSRHLPLPGTYNIRDLGGYEAGEGRTQWRRILRADALHKLDEAGVAALIDAGVRTVIDLRHDHELATAPNPFRGSDAVRYVNISLFDQLTPPGAGLDEQGRQTNVLLELYKLALERRPEAIRDVLSAIAEAPEGAVLFHCTAGKDRTGIIAALLLALGGVDRETIGADYALTAKMIAPLIDELVAGAAARGADIASFRLLLGAAPETMEAFLTHLDTTYGGAPAYLRSVGIDDELRDQLRRRLMAPAAEA
ncbi:MAG: tyrosine-protein phosphatase [Devosia sp.]|nr:tyrosine-protein phosphatase [Devosia sp.]